MRTLAILPMKSFDAAKGRLAEALGHGSRHLLAQAMFSDVLATLRRVPSVDAIAVVTDDREAEAILRGERITLLRDDRRAGQSAAASIGIRYALAGGFDRVLLVPGDTPLADPLELEALLVEGEAAGLELAIVPDRHGTGTNALLIAPPGALEPSFGPGSFERHLESARAAELSHRAIEVPSLMHDVDTPEDLTALAALLGESRAVAPRTSGALRQFDRLHAGPTEPGATVAESTPVSA